MDKVLQQLKNVKKEDLEKILNMITKEKKTESNITSGESNNEKPSNNSMDISKVKDLLQKFGTSDKVKEILQKFKLGNKVLALFGGKKAGKTETPHYPTEHEDYEFNFDYEEHADDYRDDYGDDHSNDTSYDDDYSDDDYSSYHDDDSSHGSSDHNGAKDYNDIGSDNNKHIFYHVHKNNVLYQNDDDEESAGSGRLCGASVSNGSDGTVFLEGLPDSLGSVRSDGSNDSGRSHYSFD